VAVAFFAFGTLALLAAGLLVLSGVTRITRIRPRLE
jgi:hypothetical protein